MRESAYILHCQFGKNNCGDKWTVGCHVLVHVLDFVSRIPTVDAIEYVNEQAVERCNQRMKRSLGRLKGDIPKALKHVNALSL